MALFSSSFFSYTIFLHPEEKMGVILAVSIPGKLNWLALSLFYAWCSHRAARAFGVLFLVLPYTQMHVKHSGFQIFFVLWDLNPNLRLFWDQKMAQLLNGQTRDTTTIVMNATYYTWSYEVLNLIGDWTRSLDWSPPYKVLCRPSCYKQTKLYLNLFFASLSPLLPLTTPLSRWVIS